MTASAAALVALLAVGVMKLPAALMRCLWAADSAGDILDVASAGAAGTEESSRNDFEGKLSLQTSRGGGSVAATFSSLTRFATGGGGGEALGFDGVTSTARGGTEMAGAPAGAEESSGYCVPQ